MNTVQQRMKQLLMPLDAHIFEFQDESAAHAGHVGNLGGGHYAILLVSDAFEGMSRVARQRCVHALLAELFASQDIHALSIMARTPTEYFQ